MVKKTKRSFSKSEKITLWLASGGYCEICGQSLEDGFEADHIIPYSKGGHTAIQNGAALCRKCNRRKSNSMTTEQFMSPFGIDYPTGFKPREWQSEFFEKFCTKQNTSSVIAETRIRPDNFSFLLNVTPGGGKTAASGFVGYALLRQNSGGVKKSTGIDWVIVVVPSDHLRNQFARDISQLFKLDFYHGKSCQFPIKDYQGEVITYQQLAQNPTVYQHRCLKKNVLVIADEVHHVGDTKSWGDAFKLAFSEAYYRLLTTGTAFRSDNIPIPFVNYQKIDEENKMICQPDYSYGYTLALADGIVRMVSFPRINAKCEWISSIDGEIKEKFLSEATTKREDSEALKTVLNPASQWIKNILTEANNKLNQIRETGHENAAGLVVCPSSDNGIDYVSSYAKILKEIAGEEPLIVTCDDPDSSENIKKFSDEKGKRARKWIIAIKMVSEGVDIKRLRVGVYATNILTELFFRQVVGRVIRVIHGLELDDQQAAYMYYPSHPVLDELVKTIEQERGAAISLIEEKLDDEIERSEKSGDSENPIGLFMRISDQSFSDGSVFRDQTYTQEELTVAEKYKKDNNFPQSLPTEMFAKMLRQHEEDLRKVGWEGSQANDNQGKNDEQHKTKTEKVKEKRKNVSNLAKKYTILKGKKEGTDPDHQAIHTEWMNTMGGMSQSIATLEDLIKKEKWLKEKITQLANS